MRSAFGGWYFTAVEYRNNQVWFMQKVEVTRPFFFVSPTATALCDGVIRRTSCYASPLGSRV